MMKSVETIGKTKEEAIQEAILQLNVTRDKLKIEVIEETSKFLGLFGSKECKIRATLLEDTRAKDAADAFLKGLFEVSGLNCSFSLSKDEEEVLHTKIEGEDASYLIGRRGDTLDALQLLTNLAVNKELEDYQRVMVDVEDYRQKREESLTNYVKKMARQAAKQRRTIKLDAMNPYERRIAHSVLQDDPYVTTYSEGKEPYRRVVITLKK